MDAKWITATPQSGNTSLYVFRKSFEVSGKIKSFSAKISADTRYRFVLNGNELANGPCKSSEFVKYYEEVDCTEALLQGQNQIEIRVLHVASQNEFVTTVHKEKPALYFDGTIVTESGIEKIISDESFSAFLAKHISFPERNIMATVCPFECSDGEDEFHKLNVEELYTPNVQNNFYSKWGVKEPYFLKKRPIQILTALPKTELKAVREYYDAKGKYNIILDSGIYTTAMMEYEYLAEKGTKINLIYAECMMTRKEDGTLYKDMRDNLDGEIECTHKFGNDFYDKIIASGKESSYKPFWYRVFRFIRVECSEKPKFFRAYASRYTYDFEKDAVENGIGSFECSTPEFLKMWEVSRNTIECCTHETFVDCPFYEQQQYIGDGRFEAMYAWRLSNDSKIQKKALVDTLHSLQPEGIVAATAPNSQVQILPFTSFYFINYIREYLRFTGDVELIKTLIGAIYSAIEYFERSKTADGLVFISDGCCFLDWSEKWEKGFPEGGDKNPMTIINLMYAASLKDAVEICKAAGYEGLAEDFRLRYTNIVNAVNSICFDTETGLYIDIPGKKLYSEHAGVWAILSGAIKGENAYNLAEKIMNDPVVVKSSFSKNYDLLRALDVVGLYEKYAPAILEKWNLMLEKNCTTWCESTSFPRSECHGWSCIPMYEMSAQILGVTPVENGYTKARIRPYTLGLSYAKGRVPTPFGYIDVSWSMEDGKFSLEVSSNIEVEMEIITPNGETVDVFTNHYIMK